MMDRRTILLRRIRWLLAFFMTALVVSWLTAFPLEWELDVLAGLFGIPQEASPESYTGLRHWIGTRLRRGNVDAEVKFMTDR